MATKKKTVNEARLEDGREPLTEEQYNQLMMVVPTGAVSLDDIPSAREVYEANKPTPTSAPSQE